MRQRLFSRQLLLLIIAVIATVLLLTLTNHTLAEPRPAQITPTPISLFEQEQGQSVESLSPIDWAGFWQTLTDIAPALLLAAILGGLIAYRRRLTVFEYDLFLAHILLSVAGALMMLIVGNQLVRAFGLLGAASVVRYRYGLRNPRDASMLIIALGLGMAAGVRLYALAVSAAAIVFIFSRGLDFFTARSGLLLVVTRPTRLRVRTIHLSETMANIDQVFARRGIEYRVRRFRRSRKAMREGKPVFILDYTVQLDPEESRELLTSEITDPAVVLVRWNTEKPRKA